MTAAVAALKADAALVTALGGERVYHASASRPIEIPSIEWMMIFDRDAESLNPILVQFDYWARSPDLAATIERRIRRVLHRNIRRTFAGVDCATLYEDSRDHDHPEPGVVHRSLDFRFEPVRAR